jgi:SAM-dependent methyltransferase
VTQPRSRDYGSAVLDALRARLARRSFDYQWAQLPTGAWLSDDPRFGEQVDRIVAEEELAIDRAWFAGRRVLDAGCGNGRWIEGFLRLGCEVTALDASPNALAQVRARYGDRVRTIEGDVLAADRLLPGERFDLVWSWGVLHHTEDTGRGVRALAPLVADDGVLYLYLYGRDTAPERAARTKLYAARAVLNILPFRARRAVLERLFGKRRAHEAFDLLSTPLNRRTTFEEAGALVRDAGLPRAVRTIDHTEVFLRADRGHSSADGHYREPATAPYWFQQQGAAASVPTP